MTPRPQGSRPPRERGRRDARLDFWRGLFLVDMVLVHLAFEGVDFGRMLGPLIADYTRLAAGGFVFTSGLGVGLVFLPRVVEPVSRRAAYRDLWRRAGYVLGVHWVTAAGFIALDAGRGWHPGTETLAADVLLLRYAPPYGDVLPFYVAMLLVSPLLLDAIRRGAWPLVAILSTVTFAWGRTHPWALSPRADDIFPLALWQALFVGGMLVGAALPHLDRAPRARRLAIAVGAAAAFAMLTFAAYGPPLGMDLGGRGRSLTFVKVPLSAGELLRYLSGSLTVVLGSALVWRRIADTGVVRWIGRLGRRSLPLYVAHVWVQALLMPLVWYGWLVGASEMLLAPMALALLSASAWALGHVRAPRGLGRALRGPAAAPAGAVAALALLAVVHTTGDPSVATPDAGAAPGVELLEFDPAEDGSYGVRTVEEEPGDADASAEGSLVLDGDVVEPDELPAVLESESEPDAV